MGIIQKKISSKINRNQVYADISLQIELDEHFKNLPYVREAYCCRLANQVALSGAVPHNDEEKNTHRLRHTQVLYRTRRPGSDWMPITVCTISYRIACPTFLHVSVFVATCDGGEKTQDDVHGLVGEC